MRSEATKRGTAKNWITSTSTTSTIAYRDGVERELLREEARSSRRKGASAVGGGGEEERDDGVGRERVRL